LQLGALYSPDRFQIGANSAISGVGPEYIPALRLQSPVEVLLPDYPVASEVGAC
jgi:hypothetical protein